MAENNWIKYWQKAKRKANKKNAERARQGDRTALIGNGTLKGIIK